MKKQLCTCTGSCKGKEGLGEGWVCALETYNIPETSKEEITFESPSGKRTFRIDDHEIVTDNDGLDSLFDNVVVSDEARLLVQIEAFRRDINDMMWKLCEMQQQLEKLTK